MTDHPRAGPDREAHSSHLDRILAEHRRMRDKDTRDVAAVIDRARAVSGRAAAGPGGGAPLPRDGAGPFTAAIRDGVARDGVAVIAEIKRRSPSAGQLAVGLDVADVARAYETGGAACLSVLTDGPFFGGSRADLVAARRACGLPVLRKDFTVGPLDVCDAALMGADAVLLIVAALADSELAELLGLSRALHLEAMVEVHDEEELERALGIGADLIGVNQRDLVTFDVDGSRAARLRSGIPPGVITVAESGIRSGRDVAQLREAGFEAVLVGESLVRAPDRASAVRALRLP